MLREWMLRAYVKVKLALQNDSGQALTEYGLIIALVAITVITVLGLLSGRLQAVFQQIVNAIPNNG